MMNEMQQLLSSEPSKTTQPAASDVILGVQIEPDGSPGLGPKIMRCPFLLLSGASQTAPAALRALVICRHDDKGHQCSECSAVAIRSLSQAVQAANDAGRLFFSCYPSEAQQREHPILLTQ